MSKIPLTSGFTLIPEGEYVFRVYEVKNDEEFGKLEIKLVSAKGLTYNNRFNLKNSNDEWNEGALNAFSYFAKNVLDDFTRDEIEPEELLNHYVRGAIVHTDPQPNINDPSKTVVFAKLTDLSPASEYDETPVEKALTLGKGTSQPKPSPKPQTAKPAPANKGLDLDSLLG